MISESDDKSAINQLKVKKCSYAEAFSLPMSAVPGRGAGLHAGGWCYGTCGQPHPLTACGALTAEAGQTSGRCFEWRLTQNPRPRFLATQQASYCAHWLGYAIRPGMPAETSPIQPIVVSNCRHQSKKVIICCMTKTICPRRGGLGSARDGPPCRQTFFLQVADSRSMPTG